LQTGWQLGSANGSYIEGKEACAREQLGGANTLVGHQKLATEVSGPVEPGLIKIPAERVGRPPISRDPMINPWL